MNELGPFDCPECRHDNGNVYEDPDNWGKEGGKPVRVLKSWHTDPPLMNRRYHNLVEMTCAKCGHKFKFEDESY